MQGRVHRQPHMRALGPAVNQQVVVRWRKAHRSWRDGVLVLRLAQRQGAAGLKNLHQQAAPVPGQVQHHEHRRLQCGGQCGQQLQQGIDTARRAAHHDGCVAPGRCGSGGEVLGAHSPAFLR